MKVKLFWKQNPAAYGQPNAGDFENEINAWLGDHPRIKIVEVKQSSSGGSFHAPLWFISVWYEDDGESTDDPDPPPMA